MQRIDFYQQEFRPLKVMLPLAQMLGILGSVICILVVTAGYLHWAQEAMQKEFAKLDGLNKKQQGTLSQLTTDVAAMRVQPALEAQVKSMREEITNQERLLASLRKRSNSHNVSFANYLQGLMDHHLDGVSIARLSIEQAGAEMRIEGLASAPEFLPRYLEGLKQADALQGLGFSVFELERHSNDPRVRFQLSSRADEPNQAP